MRQTVAFVLLISCSVSLFAASPAVVRGSKGVVASRSALASEVGVEIMKAGGNAFDAAVAVGFALAVTYPSAGNLGGGGFMLGYTEKGQKFALDFREKAPALAHKDMFLDGSGQVVSGLSTKSHLAVGVPGSVAGLLAVLEKYGSLSPQQVIAPAIALAEQGFALNYDIARQFEKKLPAMANYPASMAKFSKAGERYQAGEIWKQPYLASTLKRIAEHGEAGFYQGPTADLLVAEMQRGGGIISKQDLKDYEVVWRSPIQGEYRGYHLLGMPPPSSGGVLVQQILNSIEPFDVRGMKWGSAELIHLMVEAQRRAFADRSEHLGDSDFYPVPVERLIAKSYARKRFANFDPRKASDSDVISPGKTAPQESVETTHYSVMDHWGNAVSVTTTLNLGYGNKVVVEGAGFLLNNEMDDFSAKPGAPNAYGLLGSEANAISAGKRMLSSMSPTIVIKEGKPYLVTGSPGGSTIINTTLQVLVNVIDHQMPLNDAVALPRFHHQWKPNQIHFERYGISVDAQRKLRAMKHQQLIQMNRMIGDANSVMNADGVLMGMSDPRNQGGAAAY
ncbi:MAG: gamma-glutamyltransferase [Gammaproteobacteria bacterium]|nr:gamma-glutamyltransferase [Gammaproteobacteria bacterium]